MLAEYKFDQDRKVLKILSGIINASITPVLICDLEGNILSVNEPQEKLYNCCNSTLIGQNISGFFNSSPSGIDFDDIMYQIKKNEIWEGEIFEKVSAKKIHLKIKSKLLKDFKNNPIAIIRYSQELDLNKKIQEVEKFKIAIQHSHEIIFMTDNKGIINYVNPQFEEFYGYSSNEVIGKSPRLIKSGLMPDEFYRVFWNKVISGKNCDEEFTNRNKNGNLVTVQASVSPFFDEKNVIAGFISIQRDITEQKQNEELLRRALDKAEESDNLKTAFLNQMSHEIRTPLNSILGFMSIMEEELVSKGNTHLAQYFASINRSAARLQRTIEDILAMSSIQIGQFYTSVNKVNLEEILRLLIQDFKSLAAEKSIEFIFINNAVNTFIQADSYTIINSFQHLLDNALKFTSKGKVEVEIYEKEDSLCVDIKDTGIGISKEYMDNLFKPFTQEEVGYNRRYDGNGLGLALTKEFLRLNHANIYVNSEKEKGSTFTVVFYRSEEEY